MSRNNFDVNAREEISLDFNTAKRSMMLPLSNLKMLSLFDIRLFPVKNFRIIERASFVYCCC